MLSNSQYDINKHLVGNVTKCELEWLAINNNFIGLTINTLGYFSAIRISSSDEQSRTDSIFKAIEFAYKMGLKRNDEYELFLDSNSSNKILLDITSIYLLFRQRLMILEIPNYERIATDRVVNLIGKMRNFFDINNRNGTNELKSYLCSNIVMVRKFNTIEAGLQSRITSALINHEHL